MYKPKTIAYNIIQLVRIHYQLFKATSLHPLLDIHDSQNDLSCLWSFPLLGPTPTSTL
jgi:hypothetical protein